MGHDISIDNRAITTPPTDDIKINPAVYHYLAIEFATTKDLKPYMDISEGYRYKYVLKILMAINALDRPTKTMVMFRLGLSEKPVISNINYLFSIGYLEKVKRSRLIIPFGKYKADVGYRLTTKGKGVLKACTDHLLR